MVHYDPLTAGRDEVHTVDDYEPTPVGDEAGSRYGYGSYTGRARHVGTVYRGAASGRHRKAVRVAVVLMRVWSGTIIMLGLAFMWVLVTGYRVPTWFQLTLESVPGVCLVAVGIFGLVSVSQGDHV